MLQTSSNNSVETELTLPWTKIDQYATYVIFLGEKYSGYTQKDDLQRSYGLYIALHGIGLKITAMVIYLDGMEIKN